jgi:hypothetical protein
MPDLVFLTSDDLILYKLIENWFCHLCGCLCVLKISGCTRHAGLKWHTARRATWVGTPEQQKPVPCLGRGPDTWASTARPALVSRPCRTVFLGTGMSLTGRGPGPELQD